MSQNGQVLSHSGSVLAFQLAPYLFGKEFHANGAAGEDVASTNDWTDDATERRLEGEILFECHIQEYGVFPLLFLE